MIPYQILCRFQILATIYGIDKKTLKSTNMNNEILTRDSQWIKSFFKSSKRMLDDIDLLVKNSKPHLNGERFLTDKEVSEKLKISRRTLQDYRTQGKIAYIQLGGKILYKESDIEKMLESGYQESIE